MEEHDEVQRLEWAELFYIHSDMTRLAHTAAETLPSFEMYSQDLPSPVGLMVFAEPAVWVTEDLGMFPVHAVCWSPAPDSPDWLWITCYQARTHYGTALADASGQAVTAWPRLMYGHTLGSGWRLGYANSLTTRADEPVRYDLWHIARSAWLLMQQESVSESESAQAPRGPRRQMQRAGREPGKVRLINVRNARGEGDGTGSREYRHQWIVRGHWRQQWHPKRETHRPIWIDPHLKGPADAPILGGEKVHVVNAQRAITRVLESSRVPSHQ